MDRWNREQHIADYIAMLLCNPSHYGSRVMEIASADDRCFKITTQGITFKVTVREES